MLCLTRCSPAWSVRIWCLALVILSDCSLGALVAGLLTVTSIEALRRYGRMESNTAMGVVFSIAFAIGVILIRVGHTDHVDLDPNCVLYGQLELLVWFDAPVFVSRRWLYRCVSRHAFLDLVVADHGPAVSSFVVICFKELRLVLIRSRIGTNSWFSSRAINMVLMLLVSVATVASFEAVGSVLVIAALLVPAFDGSTLHRSSQESDPGQCPGRPFLQSSVIC